MESSPPAQRRRGRARRFPAGGVLRIIVATAFVAGVYAAGRLGVEMARDRLPETDREKAAIPEQASLTLGETGDPVYLAESPESLRRFFADHPSPEERASADLSGIDIRRLRGAVEATTLRSEAEATRVRISSGAIAGAAYWVHHTQLPDPASFDPIISPLPGAEAESPAPDPDRRRP